ncbi:MAG: anibiotic ABC transporter [Hamadaea sp.]|nr:anibiotic ABC transporter [Hamadaea sp.]
MSAFRGTLRLTRLAARRDRVHLPIWILATAGLASAGAAAVIDEFPTEEGRVTALTGAVTSPAVLMMRGVPVGATEGALVNFRNLLSILVMAALMSTFLVVRHTRQNEESGRAELVGAGVVGRYANLAAALLLAVIANVLLGAFVIAALLGAGLPAAGSVAFGAATTVVGLSFAGIAALCAQLFVSARAANATAATAIGVAFVVRGIGDALGEINADGFTVTSGWPVWLSPIGWGEQVLPFGEERWWPLALPLVLFVALAAAAFALVDRRDVGAGLVSARLGPPAARRGLLSPEGLAWRLNRSSVWGWVVGGAVMGFGIGSLGDTVNKSFDANQGVTGLLEQLAGTGAPNLVELLYASMMNVFGALAAGFAVQTLLRLRSEETAGHAEAVLSTATGRVRWAAAHLLTAIVGTVAFLVVSGAAMGLADLIVGGGVGVGPLIGAGLAQTPAALAVAGFVVLAFGALPRLTVPLAWLGLAVAIGFGLLGDVFGLPQAVRDVSPFSHVPAIPAVDPSATPLLALSGAATALVVVGLALFRRRDLAP